MVAVAISTVTLTGVNLHTRFHSSRFSSHSKRSSSTIRCQAVNGDKKKQSSSSSSRNVFDNASNLLTNLLSGGSLGNMPIAEGAVTDLFDRPLFFSLYDWFLEVLNFFIIINFLMFGLEFQLTVCLIDLFEFIN